MVEKFDRNLIPAIPDLSFESELWKAGIRYVAGIDEAGRGALAGPVAAAALIFPPDEALAGKLGGARDSKQMTPAARQTWSDRITGLALTWAVGFAEADEIDEYGIVPATRLAIQRALEQLSPDPEHLLIDFLRLPECVLPQTALIKGDARCLSIAAASILAKTTRDERLRQLDLEFPGYNFSANKGYVTAAHGQALRHLGYSTVHRFSFKLKE